METTAGSGASVHAIIRASIHTFLKNYLYFNAVTILVLLPYSALILLPRMRMVTTTLSIRGLEMIPATTMALQVAFTLTFLVMAKSAVIRSLGKHPQDQIFPSFLQPYVGLLKTQIWNSVLAITVSSTVSVLFSIAHQLSSTLKGFPSAGTMLIPILQAAIFYAITINLSVINNISLVISGNDNCSPAVAISMACKLRQREPGILVTAALSNLGFIGVEALFRYRVITDHRSPGIPNSWGMIREIFLISYMYSVVIILDMVACCLFLKRPSTEDHEEDEGDDDGYYVV